MKAIDDHTLEVTLSEPVPYFYKLLVHPSTSPVPKAAIEKFGEKWTQPGNIVTNGAYTLKDWVVNERIVLERSPTYWNNAKTVINQVTYLPIASEVTDVNRYRSDEIDMTYNNMPIELFQKLKKRSRTKFTLIHTCALTITKLTTRNRHSTMCVCVPH